jgi:ribonuclease P protein component
LTATDKQGRKQSHCGWFDRVFARHESVSGRFLELYLAPSDAETPCFGISVSKRVCPTAVSRNYCKRILRAWFRQHGRIFKHNDLVIRVRRRYGRREMLMVSEELAKLVRRLN